jgi:hypothetical protein
MVYISLQSFGTWCADAFLLSIEIDLDTPEAPCRQPRDELRIPPAHFQRVQTSQHVWEEEYVRASIRVFIHLLPNIHVSCMSDEYENFSSPVSGATSFLLSLASNRTKTSFLPILQFINTVLRSLSALISLN